MHVRGNVCRRKTSAHIWLKLCCLYISQLALQKHLTEYLDAIMPYSDCELWAQVYCKQRECNAELKCHHISFAYWSVQSVLRAVYRIIMLLFYITPICCADLNAGHLFLLKCVFKNMKNKQIYKQVYKYADWLTPSHLTWMQHRQHTNKHTCIINRHKGKRRTAGSCREVTVVWKAGAVGLSVLLASGYTLQWT